MNVIPLTALEDVLKVESDADFYQILAELPENLRALRAASKRPGHAGFKWPILWRPGGGPSTLTTHCTDGAITQPLLG